MSQTVVNFLKLRPRLREVREQDDGWILALFDYDSKDADVLFLLTELHNVGVISEFRRESHLTFPSKLGGSGVLELRIDTGKLPNYFETYDSLIKSNLDTFRQEFVVWEKNNKLHAGYTAACTLLQFLKSKAEVWDTTGQRFFLVDQQAVEIPLTSYTALQTANLPASLTGIVRFLDDAHLDADARWAFFRKAALRLLRDLPKEKRLGVLMENLGSVFDRAQQDHSLYLERFSFEDLLKNFDEKRLKFVSDLNQILASIQTALVAVPIGFFLIAEKLKPANGWAGQNIVLAAGGLVFFALVFVLSLNQGKTLQGIKLAIVDFETEQKNKVTEKFDRLQKLLRSTWSQYRRVLCLLWVVHALLIVFSAIIVAALLWCSIPDWQSLLPYIPKDLAISPVKTLSVNPVTTGGKETTSTSNSPPVMAPSQVTESQDQKRAEDGHWWETIFSVTIGSVLGMIASWWIFYLQSRKEARAEMTFNNRVLLAIKSEIEGLMDSFNSGLGGRLAQLPEKVPFTFWLHISQNFFTVYESNASHLGKIDAALAERIVKFYILLKSFVEDLALNKATLERYVVLETKFKESQVKIVALPDDIRQQVENTFDELVYRAGQLKLKHYSILQDAVNLLADLSKIKIKPDKERSAWKALLIRARYFRRQILRTGF